MLKWRFLIIAFLIAAPADAYFKNLVADARSTGMGNAFVAVADDSNAPLWNASGIAQLENQEISTTFAALYVGLNAKLYNGITDRLGSHFVSYVYPSSSGSFAISWSSFRSYLYDESILCLSYGKRLNGCLYAGMNLKKAGWSIDGNEYTEQDMNIPGGVSKNGFTFDLSALYKLYSGFSIGFSAENLLPADVGLNTKQNIPISLRCGIAYRFSNLKNIKLLSAIDLIYRMHDETKVCMGIEGWLFDGILGARAGLNPTSANSGISYRVIMKQLEIQMDYAFTYPFSIEETYGSHRISMIMRL